MKQRDTPAYPELDRFDRAANAAIAMLMVARRDKVQRAGLVPSALELIQRLGEELREIEGMDPTWWGWESNRVPESEYAWPGKPRRM